MGSYKVRSMLRACCVPALAAGFAAAAHAEATLPPMKPGFWQTDMVMKIAMPGQPTQADPTPTTTYNCMDAASMAASMKRMTGAVPGCNFDLEGGSGNYTITMNCTNPGGQQGSMTGNGTITLQGDSAMHMVENSSANMQGMQMTMSMSGDSKWVGDCPAGVMPGDFGVMQNGAFVKEGSSTALPGQ